MGHPHWGPSARLLEWQFYSEPLQSLPDEPLHFGQSTHTELTFRSWSMMAKRRAATTRKKTSPKKAAPKKTAKKSTVKKKAATKQAPARRKKAARRELIDTGRDKRFVRRDEQGQFAESDDVGKSLTQDRRKKAKKVVRAGQGDKGDRRKQAR
jgi:hypothetical protein